MAKDMIDRDKTVRKLVTQSRSSAKERHLSFDLTVGNVTEIWDNQTGRCALSGLAFSEERYEHARVKMPFAASIDRIDDKKGYVLGNVRLVCAAANFARNQWGDTVLRRLAHGIVETERVVEGPWYREQRRKLRAAEKAAAGMTGKKLERQKHVISGLKAAITKGPARSRGAARKAKRP